MRLLDWSIYHESLSILLIKISWIIDPATSDAQLSVVCVRRPRGSAVGSGQCQGRRELLLTRYTVTPSPGGCLHPASISPHTEEDSLLQFFFTTKSLTNPGMFHGFFEAKC